VIPLFFSQCNSSLITITEPSMTRFLMSLDEAIDLVIFAMEHGKNGDLFVKKSKAAKIIDIARVIMKIQKTDCELRYIGPRHSEKFHETLLTKEEAMRAVDEGEYFRVPIDSRDLNYETYESSIGKDLVKEYTSLEAGLLDLDELYELFISNKEIQDLIK
jgi:UDP-glucose 4-epimerase